MLRLEAACAHPQFGSPTHGAALLQVQAGVPGLQLGPVSALCQQPLPLLFPLIQRVEPWHVGSLFVAFRGSSGSPALLEWEPSSRGSLWPWLPLSQIFT